MSKITLQREAFFMPGEDGNRFCLLTRPEAEQKGALLFVHPFAEELNKSRHMVALGARAFAAAGWAVLQMDCFGCGDSDGDFGDASWQAWVADVDCGARWLRDRFGMEPALWSLRAGSLLVSDWFKVSGRHGAWLAWQPVASGKQHLTQFLRLKAANEMLADSDGAAAMAVLREAMRRGETVEVAGYSLSPALVRGLEAAAIPAELPGCAPVVLLELALGERGEVSPALSRLAEVWVRSGVKVTTEVVAGAAFWQTQEIELAPDFINRSVSALEWF